MKCYAKFRARIKKIILALTSGSDEGGITVWSGKLKEKSNLADSTDKSWSVCSVFQSELHANGRLFWSVFE